MSVPKARKLDFWMLMVCLFQMYIVYRIRIGGAYGQYDMEREFHAKRNVAARQINVQPGLQIFHLQ